MVYVPRRATNFPLSNLGGTAGLRRTHVVTRFRPHLNHDSIWRTLKTDGLNRRPKFATDALSKGQGTLHGYDLGFRHRRLFKSQLQERAIRTACS